jgi:hypothetical protein
MLPESQFKCFRRCIEDAACLGSSCVVNQDLNPVFPYYVPNMMSHQTGSEKSPPPIDGAGHPVFEAEQRLAQSLGSLAINDTIGSVQCQFLCRASPIPWELPQITAYLSFIEIFIMNILYHKVKRWPLAVGRWPFFEKILFDNIK